MTITVGRLLAVVAVVLAVIGIFIFGWQRAHSHSGPPTFESQAASICRGGLAAIKRAPDFQTALAGSRDMRLKLSTLAPAPEQRQAFERWLTDLKATEDAAVRGDVAAVQETDLLVQEDARQLGLADSCVTTPN